MTESPQVPADADAATRRALVRAAYELLSTGPLEPDLVGQSARRLGLDLALGRRAAGDETAFLIGVLELRDQAAEGIVPVAGGVATIRGMLALALHNQRRPGLMTLFATLSGAATAPPHPAHDYFRRRYAWVRGLLTLGFEEMRAAGQLRTDLPSAELARSLMAVMDGLQVQWLLEGEHLDMKTQLHGWLGPLVAVDL